MRDDVRRTPSDIDKGNTARSFIAPLIFAGLWRAVIIFIYLFLLFIFYFLNFFLLGWDCLGDLLMWKDWAVLPEGIN